MPYEIRDIASFFTFWTGIIILAYIITECRIGMMTPRPCLNSYDKTASCFQNTTLTDTTTSKDI